MGGSQLWEGATSAFFLIKVRRARQTDVLRFLLVDGLDVARVTPRWEYKVHFSFIFHGEIKGIKFQSFKHS